MVRSWGLMCLVVCLVLTGCGQKKAASISGGESRAETLHPAANESAESNPNSSFAGLRVATNDFVLPAIAGFESSQVLLMRGTGQGNFDAQEGTLYLAKFDGNAPEILANEVLAASVTASEDGTMVAYMSYDGRRRNFYMQEIATRTVTQLFRASSDFAFIDGWSPDMQWIVARDNGENIVFSRDAQTQHHFANAFTFWLSDNRLLIIETPDLFGANEDARHIEAIYLFNPSDGSRTDLTLPFTEFTSDTFPGAVIRTALQAENTDILSNLAGAQGALFFPLPLTPDTLFLQGALDNEQCSERTLIALDFADGTQQLLASLPETLALTDFAVLSDGSIVVQRWFSASCTLNPDEMQSELLQIKPDEAPTVLIDSIYPGFINGFVRTAVGRHYAFSPDARYVLWISGSEQILATTLHIRDLQTGDTADLMTWQSATPTDFFASEAFTGVYWLP